MNGQTHWNFHPFCWETHAREKRLPQITRLAPFQHGFSFDWYDNVPCAEHILSYRVMGTQAWQTQAVSESPVTVSGLMENADYECTLSAGERVSRTRLVHIAEAPGIVVNYIHPGEKSLRDEGYSTCSPSLIRVPSGALIAMHDLYYPGRPYHMSYVFRSEDEGKTWRHIAELSPCIWPELFVHRGELYCMAVSQEYGDLLLGVSHDEGYTWDAPITLMRGEGYSGIGPHKNPTPFVHHNGRIYEGVEFGAWCVHDHQSMMLSCDENADLMHPENWKWGEPLQYPAGEGMPNVTGGWIEGNAVEGPDGNLYNLMRIDWQGYGKAALLKVPEDPEAQEEFVGLIDMPIGSNSKFYVLYDEVSRHYIALGTEQNEELRGRLVMSMAVSRDLYHWRIAHRLFDHRNEDPAKVGFQYPNFIISGEDLLVLTRVAIHGAENFHNANHILFTKVEGFRKYL